MSINIARLARSAAFASTAALGLAFAAPAAATTISVDLIEQSSDLGSADFSWTFDVPTSFTSALFTLTLDGDFNGSTEYADVSFDGFSLGRVLDGTSTNVARGEFDLFDFARNDDADTSSAGGAPVTGTATLLFADIGGFALDGSAVFLVDTSDGVDNVTTTVSATIDFFDASTDVVAVPTPASAALLGLGLLAVGAARRSRC